MCMEDYRIGRKIWYRRSFLDFSSSPVVSVNADTKRVGFTVCYPAAQFIKMGLDQLSLVSGVDMVSVIPLAPSTPYIFKITDWGQIITQKLWFYDYAGTAFVIPITETLLTDE